MNLDAKEGKMITDEQEKRIEDGVKALNELGYYSIANQVTRALIQQRRARMLRETRR